MYYFLNGFNAIGGPDKIQAAGCDPQAVVGQPLFYRKWNETLFDHQSIVFIPGGWTDFSTLTIYGVFQKILYCRMKLWNYIYLIQISLVSFCENQLEYYSRP